MPNLECGTSAPPQQRLLDKLCGMVLQGTFAHFLIVGISLLLYHACRQIYRLLTNAQARQTELVQTILHSEFHSDRAYCRLRKSSDRNIVLEMFCKANSL